MYYGGRIVTTFCIIIFHSDIANTLAAAVTILEFHCIIGVTTQDHHYICYDINKKNPDILRQKCEEAENLLSQLYEHIKNQLH